VVIFCVLLSVACGEKFGLERKTVKVVEDVLTHVGPSSEDITEEATDEIAFVSELLSKLKITQHELLDLLIDQKGEYSKEKELSEILSKFNLSPQDLLHIVFEAEHARGLLQTTVSTQSIKEEPSSEGINAEAGDVTHLLNPNASTHEPNATKSSAPGKPGIRDLGFEKAVNKTVDTVKDIGGSHLSPKDKKLVSHFLKGKSLPTLPPFNIGHRVEELKDRTHSGRLREITRPSSPGSRSGNLIDHLPAVPELRTSTTSAPTQTSTYQNETTTTSNTTAGPVSTTSTSGAHMVTVGLLTLVGLFML